MGQMDKGNVASDVQALIIKLYGAGKGIEKYIWLHFGKKECLQSLMLQRLNAIGGTERPKIASRL